MVLITMVLHQCAPSLRSQLCALLVKTIRITCTNEKSLLPLFECDSADVPNVAVGLESIRDKVVAGQRLSLDDGERMFRHPDVLSLGALAQWAALKRHGKRVYYVVNGHINYSNFCTLSCAFCSFYRRKGKDRRANGYEMPLDEVLHHAEAIALSGATEIHIVGGLHPDFPFTYYTDMLRGIRARHPKVGLKCFTAIEVYHLATLAGLSPVETLSALKEAGLDTLPGGGAEVLDDGLRKKICAGKETSAEWLDLHRQAHSLGIKSNATLLYGHIESPRQRLEHLIQLRELQDETQGFLAFIPLSYHPENNVLKVQRGPSGLDEVRTYAISRLMLDNFPHVKAYWIMLTVPIAQITLAYGATDFDGTVLQEKIYHMAGSETPQALTAADLRRYIREAGRDPVERDHVYREITRGSQGPLDWSAASVTPAAIPLFA